jgi:hypothetical protein
LTRGKAPKCRNGLVKPRVLFLTCQSETDVPNFHIL